MFHQTMMHGMKCRWRHYPNDEMSDQQNICMSLKIIIIEINAGAWEQCVNFSRKCYQKAGPVTNNIHGTRMHLDKQLQGCRIHRTLGPVEVKVLPV